VAIRLDKTDIVDWLIKEIQENQIQLDSRVKKYVQKILIDKREYLHSISFGLICINAEYKEGK